jgi:ribonuclease BN (tRNA processing enzyme)
MKQKMRVWFSEIYPYLENVLQYIEIHEFDPIEVIKGSDWQVAVFPVEHGIEAYGFKFIAGGKTIIYSGDTGYSERLILEAKGADLLIHECSYPSTIRRAGHTTPLKLGEIAHRAAVKKIVLTHFYPICDGKEQEFDLEIKKKYKGGVIFGTDLLEIEV